MQDELNKCNKILGLAHDAAIQYYDKIADVAAKLSPSNNYMETIKLLSKTLKLPKTLLDHVKLFDEIDTVTLYINDISLMMLNDTYSKATLHSRSATYALQINQHKNTFLQCKELWSKINLDTLAIYEGDVDIDELLTIASTHMNYFIVSIMKKSKDRRLDHIIEKQKDIVLGSIERMKNSTALGCQATITRGDLSPTNIIKSYDELKSLSSNGPSIIILRNGCPSPILFNMDGLVSIDYITSHDLLTRTFAGLNKKIISRYNTVCVGEDTSPGQIEIIPGTDVLYTVYENISGDKYRLLKLNNTQELLKESQVKFIKSVSSRPIHYANQSYVSPIDPYYTRRVDKYMSTRVNLSSDIIQRRIYEKLVTWFETIIQNITSNQTFHQYIIDKDVINETIIDILTSETETYSDYTDPEIMCSHIIKFESICKEFTQIIEKNLMKINIPSRLFAEETPSAVKNTLYGYMNDLYKPAIEDMGDRWAEFEMEIKESFSKYIH